MEALHRTAGTPPPTARLRRWEMKMTLRAWPGSKLSLARAAGIDPRTIDAASEQTCAKVADALQRTALRFMERSSLIQARAIENLPATRAKASLHDWPERRSDG